MELAALVTRGVVDLVDAALLRPDRLDCDVFEPLGVILGLALALVLGLGLLLRVDVEALRREGVLGLGVGALEGLGEDVEGILLVHC